MRELLMAAQAARSAAPVAASAVTSDGADAGPSWLETEGWDARLNTVQAIYADRVSRMPSLPWEDDTYRRCEYTVNDWSTGRWAVDDSAVS